MDVYLCKLGCAFEPAPGFYLTSSMGKKGFFKEEISSYAGILLPPV